MVKERSLNECMLSDRGLSSHNSVAVFQTFQEGFPAVDRVRDGLRSQVFYTCAEVLSTLAVLAECCQFNRSTAGHWLLPRLWIDLASEKDRLDRPNSK